ncbi:hypothetical protein Curi_c14570 [Gottschalkia acidurici 9a]|uniref:Uncharacterized protein n=1 Tax=Gottschalkia acidurici (strain ATCC 7906 / DSM 604 / BCRC 14475 / CIP 104303 / KCTC 5404 / NCIMB 10678 / 9a) TaxID=1128398 RepID=K0B098_GOTA9|nr:hypothetical protein [Gottschalkia acidurici]AFS78467.1 hypothetical protein Curi_c14570 [Gottschalkia acidurici 9a]
MLIDGSFETEYNTLYQGQVFSDINSITSKLAARSSNSWTHNGYDYRRIDSGSTYEVTVGGTYKRLGASTNVYSTAEFYCTLRGAIQ